MSTDNERREVARRLRGIDFSDVLFDSELVDAIEYVCGSKRKRRDFVKIVDRLADLIEPPLQCPHYHSDRHYCSVHEDVRPIDRDALLELADEMDVDAGCNAYVDDYDVYGYARRIREALGVSGDA